MNTQRSLLEKACSSIVLFKFKGNYKCKFCLGESKHYLNFKMKALVKDLSNAKYYKEQAKCFFQ